VVPYFFMCSRPAAPNIHGATGNANSSMAASALMWLPSGDSRSSAPPASAPGCIFSKPRAITQSARPPRMLCAARYSAVEPVEQLLLTLTIGMPVMPSS
jgi:hypothetical protein